MIIKCPKCGGTDFVTTTNGTRNGRVRLKRQCCPHEVSAVA